MSRSSTAKEKSISSLQKLEYFINSNLERTNFQHKHIHKLVQDLIEDGKLEYILDLLEEYESYYALRANLNQIKSKVCELSEEDPQTKSISIKNALIDLEKFLDSGSKNRIKKTIALDKIKDPVILARQKYNLSVLDYWKLYNKYSDTFIKQCLVKGADRLSHQFDKFEEHNAVVIDISGSTNANTTGKEVSCIEHAACCAFSIPRARDPFCGVDYYLTCNKTWKHFPVNNSILTQVEEVVNGHNYGGFSYDSIFKSLDKSYDRLFIFSDECHYKPRRFSTDEFKPNYIYHVNLSCLDKSNILDATNFELQGWNSTNDGIHYRLESGIF